MWSGGGGVDVGRTVGVGASVAVIRKVGEGPGIRVVGLAAGVDILVATGAGVA